MQGSTRNDNIIQDKTYKHADRNAYADKYRQTTKYNNKKTYINTSRTPLKRQT